MKKNLIYKILLCGLMVAGTQLPATAQTVAKETGLSTFMQIELLGLIALVGLIFGALMFDFPKSSIAGISTTGDTMIIWKTAVVRQQYISNGKFEKMLKTGIYGSAGLLVLYLIIIFLLLL